MVGYELFDAQGNLVQHHDLQDKAPWCRHGASREEVFVEKYGKELNVILNPDKERDPFAPDLRDGISGNVADLKAQNTPFFQAKARFRMDPRFAVVFNLKDRLRYERLYPGIEIFFWVDWSVVRFRSASQDIRIEPLSGVWKIGFGQLLEILKKAPLHEYVQRKNDEKGNAKSSYVIDLRDSRLSKVA